MEIKLHVVWTERHRPMRYLNDTDGSQTLLTYARTLKNIDTTEMISLLIKYKAH